MSIAARVLRVFVASPGDVRADRQALRAVIEELNRSDGERSGYRLQLACWEDDSAPAGGRPQAVINKDIGDYDVFVGLMWRRFGTPSGAAGSGTEEEFRIAYGRWQQDNGLPLMFYFCQTPFMPRTLDEVEQMRKVLVFRQELEKKALIWEYGDTGDFSTKIRKHLHKRVTELVAPRAPGASPDDTMIGQLHELWNRMDPNLQKVFSIAYNEKRLAGDGGIDTWTFFAALLDAANDPQLDRLVTAIRTRAKDALPQKIDGPAIAAPYVLQERPWLSGCVSSAVRRLSKQLPPGRVLTGVDIFVDIAKYGTGDSVRALRQQNIGPDDIDRFVRENQIDVVVTHKN